MLIMDLSSLAVKPALIYYSGGYVMMAGYGDVRNEGRELAG